MDLGSVSQTGGNAPFSAEETPTGYGYPLAVLRQMSIQQINLLPPEEVAARRQQALHESLNTFVFPPRLAGGAIRQVEVHSSPIHVDGHLLLFSIIFDVTARRQAEAELRASELISLSQVYYQNAQEKDHPHP
jgi:PAS domain S-box-containing protein